VIQSITLVEDEVVAGIIKKTGNEDLQWDSYRRFIQMFEM
jgi:pyruvate,orthophosphate dikinase